MRANARADPPLVPFSRQDGVPLTGRTIEINKRLVQGSVGAGRNDRFWVFGSIGHLKEGPLRCLVT